MKDVWFTNIFETLNFKVKGLKILCYFISKEDINNKILYLKFILFGKHSTDFKIEISCRRNYLHNRDCDIKSAFIQIRSCLKIKAKNCTNKESKLLIILNIFLFLGCLVVVFPLNDYAPNFSER